MRVVITGICGHLGSALAAWIKANKPEVEIVGIDNWSCGYMGNVEPLGFYPHTYPQSEFDVVRGDSVYPIHLGGATSFTNGDGREYLEKIIDGADYVFHFAAYAAEGLSPFIRRYDMMNNLGGTVDVVNACLNLGSVKRIVFTSSMAVYGKGRAPFSECAPRRPIDPYGVSKSACEQHLEIAAEQHEQDYCILRPHNLYGPGQSIWQVYRNVIGIWMARHLQGLPMLVYGDGQQSRAFSFIDDVVESVWRSAVEPAAGGEIINLGGSRPASIIGTAGIVADVIGGEIEHAQQRHEVREAYCTTEKSERLLGYSDQTSLREGIERMWAWAQNAWEEFPERRGSHRVAPIEVEQGLYPFWRDQLVATG